MAGGRKLIGGGDSMKTVLAHSIELDNEIGRLCESIMVVGHRGVARKMTKAEFLREAARIACRDLRGGRFKPTSQRLREGEAEIVSVGRVSR